MIIRALAAENILKYRTLRLTDVPERGIIAVSGENETGKSAIGEIICFALFGRTYALDPTRLRKLLHWGAPRGAVTMRFAAGGSEYEVQRQLDRDGGESARLSSGDQPDPTLARGPEAVNERLRRILGFGFDEYVETCYLAQREITAPHPHSPTVKRLTGISFPERCTRDLRQEVERDEQSLREIEIRLAEIEEGLRLLEADFSDPTVLKASLAETTEREQAVGQCIDQLNVATEAYCEASRRFRMHGFRRGAVSLVQSLLLLAVLGVAGIWFLLRFHPRLWPVSALRESLEGFVATLGLSAETAVAFGAVALGTLLVPVLIWSLALGLQDRKRRARARRLADVLVGIDELGTAAGGGMDAKADDVLVPGEVSLKGITSVDKPDAERRARLSRRILALEASPPEVRAAAQHETAWLGRLLEELRGQHRILEDALDRATNNKKNR
jgi:exonuclease SbcC